MRLMLAFFRSHPTRTSLMLLALLLAALAEGIGLSTLLPLLNIAVADSEVIALPGVDEAQRNAFEQHVIELLNSIGLDPTLGVLLLILLLGVTLRNGLLLIAQRQVGYTAAQVATELRLNLLHAILRCQWRYFLHQPIGKLSNALATEPLRSSQSFVAGSEAITYLVQGLIYGLIAFAVDWRATVACLLVGAVFMLALHALVRVAKQAGKKQTRLLEILMTQLTDTLQSVKPLKAMAKEYLADSVLITKTQRLNNALRKQVVSGALLSASQDQMFAILIGLGIFIALQYFAIPFTTVVVLVVGIGRMLSFFGKVQKQHHKMAIGESAYWALQNTIAGAQRAEELPSGTLQPSLKNAITCTDVVFSYDHRTLFRGLTLTCSAGQLTTLTGSSGAGKTTIIDLIIGLIQPQSGRVMVDGQLIAALDTKAWRSMIGYVPQEQLLLHDTIAHNVTLGDPAITDEAIEYALKNAGAWDFVAAMPEGTQSVVGERGSKLSGGQRQRIMIARALVHRPALLILDEATSALDTASELAICRTIKQLRGEYTIIAISHRAALVDAADRVYCIENGQATLINEREE